MSNTNIKLCEIVKINQNSQVNFHQILEYIEIIKNQKVESQPYYCEWLDPVFLDKIIEFEDEENEEIQPNTKIGNFTTFNFIKVPKVI